MILNLRDKFTYKSPSIWTARYSLNDAFMRQNCLYKKLFLGFRTLQLTIIFLPCCLLYPIKAFGCFGHDGWWGGLFKRSLMIAGPIFIKLGQWMSTRRDIYDELLIETLSTLTTESKTHSFALAIKQISALINVNEFKYIDPVPIGKSIIQIHSLGSGAIAQVHKGVLKNNDVVAIKVLHPGIHDQLDTDCNLLK